MRTSLFFCLGVGILLSTLPAHGQTVNMEHPQEIRAQKVPSADAMLARKNDTQLQKDAKELAEVSSSLQADLEGLKQGVLQKDLVDKLKRMERLSKRVREALTR